MANELTEQEKLEKLLRMAGFTLSGDGMQQDYWVDSDDETYGYEPPDLLHSLDAQERYLVPVLREKYKLYFMETAYVEQRVVCKLWFHTEHINNGVVEKYIKTLADDGVGASPALAFAEACLKLEGEGK